MYLLKEENKDHRRTIFDLKCMIKRSDNQGDVAEFKGKINKHKECMSDNMDYLKHK